jgi:hypothetical protein
MLDALNIFYLAATIGSQAINIVANAESDIEIKETTRVYAVTMRQQAPFWVDKCHYNGVLVEYARDWEELQPSTGIILPPAPEKPIGYALILTKEACPGKEARDIFSTGERFFPLFGHGKYVIRDGHRMDAVDYSSQREDARPKWMPQVLKTIQTEAAHNSIAQKFEAELVARSALTQNSEIDATIKPAEIGPTKAEEDERKDVKASKY